jgi:hypothetical protein
VKVLRPFSETIPWVNVSGRLSGNPCAVSGSTRLRSAFCMFDVRLAQPHSKFHTKCQRRAYGAALCSPVRGIGEAETAVFDIPGSWLAQLDTQQADKANMLSKRPLSQTSKLISPNSPTCSVQRRDSITTPIHKVILFSHFVDNVDSERYHVLQGPGSQSRSRRQAEYPGK